MPPSKCLDHRSAIATGTLLLASPNTPAGKARSYQGCSWETPTERIGSLPWMPRAP